MKNENATVKEIVTEAAAKFSVADSASAGRHARFISAVAEMAHGEFDAVNRFNSELARNPISAFQNYGKSACEAAASIQIRAVMLADAVKVSIDDEAKLEMLLKCTLSDLDSAILRNFYRGGSTCQISNAAEAGLREAACQFRGAVARHLGATTIYSK